ncbi:MAG TPA: CDP-alcohol phosphatidyltransferase family protein [Franconibacter pulveris]|jgi:phosphatidylglycerophosphate synthase|nr:CDP-alcohol phosphatidyltransferase family protein [Franconibacter pulveris]
MEKDIHDRRPVRTRDTRWAASAARTLQRLGCTPNAISLFSIVFSLLSALCFIAVWQLESLWMQRLLLLIAAAGIQGRLICNLLDGMVAVEGGLRSPAGAIYNELPDRISDTVLFLGAGYGLTRLNGAAELAWAASLLALFTAYVRLLGGTCGLAQRFSGPMAKQHRMAVLTAAALVGALLPVWGEVSLFGALAIIALGAAWTIVRRTRTILKALQQQEA